MDEFKPLSWQRQVLDDTSMAILITGGIGCGKTRIGIEKVKAYCRANSYSTALILGGCNIYALIEDDLEDYKHELSRNRFVFENGSVIYYGHTPYNILPSKPNWWQRLLIYLKIKKPVGQPNPIDKWQDFNLDIIFADNANRMSINQYVQLICRLRGRTYAYKQIILADSPPPSRTNDSLFWYLKQNHELNHYSIPTNYNPYLPSSYVDKVKQMGLHSDIWWINGERE